MFPAACIHGRFQILHNDHYAYFSRAAEKHGRLYIGLTGQQRDLSGETHRDRPSANPLSYWERVGMWRVLLKAIGCANEHVIGPFPIETPDALVDFVPASCICATTLRDKWSEEKVARLRRAGYEIDILPHNAQQPLASTDLRKMIAAGDDRWRELAPVPVVAYLDALGIRSRLATGG